jgi:hypothetical protein
MTTILTDKERQFPEFATAVGRGIYESALTDPDMLVMATAALTATLPVKALNRLSKVVMVYVGLRTADRLISLIARTSVRD